MIRRLRIRFLVLATAAVLAVLVILVGGINLASYQGIVSEADRFLLEENLGKEEKNRGAAGREEAGIFGKFPSDMHAFVRFFSVVLTEDGEIKSVLLPLHSPLEESEVMEMAARVYQKKADMGFQNGYRFTKQWDGAFWQLRFLDCGREIRSFQRFLLTSVLLSLAGLLLIFGILVFFSGRIVRPFGESYEKQKRFITDAGHEIKTPLTIIRADADVLEMELGQNEWLADIQSNVTRLAELTSDLVSLARMEEGDRKLEMTEVLLSAVVAETAERFQKLARAQNKELRLSIEPGLQIQAEEKAIDKLVGILLDNALKYSPDGTRIGLSLVKQGKQAELAVENRSAVPLPDGNLDRLFERFYRGDPSRNSQTGGHGIGLSMASAIAAAHGGQIHAAQPEAGTLKVSVLLPFRQKQNRALFSR